MNDDDKDLAEAFEDTWSEETEQEDELLATDRQTKRELDWQRWRDMF
jgi:hypothetical protein